MAFSTIHLQRDTNKNTPKSKNDYRYYIIDQQKCSQSVTYIQKYEAGCKQKHQYRN